MTMMLSARVFLKLSALLSLVLYLAATRTAHAATCDTFVFDVHAFACSDPFNPNCLTTSGPPAPAPAAFIARNDSAGSTAGPMIIQVQDNSAVIVYTSPVIPIGGQLVLPASLAGFKAITASNANTGAGWSTLSDTINPPPGNCSTPACTQFIFDVNAYTCTGPFNPNCLSTSGPASPTPAQFIVRNDTSGQNGGPLILQVQDNSAVVVYTSPPIPIGGELQLPPNLAGFKLITATNANNASGWSTSGVTINPPPASCPALPWPAIALLVPSLGLFGSWLIRRKRATLVTG
jgi:hypothetical protein